MQNQDTIVSEPRQNPQHNDLVDQAGLTLLSRRLHRLLRRSSQGIVDGCLMDFALCTSVIDFKLCYGYNCYS